eukprot:gene27140-33822_t
MSVSTAIADIIPAVGITIIVEAAMIGVHNWTFEHHGDLYSSLITLPLIREHDCAQPSL